MSLLRCARAYRLVPLYSRSLGVGQRAFAAGDASDKASDKASAKASDKVAEIQKLVAENKVVVFSKTSCPFSAEAVALLEEIDIHPVIIQLDQRDDGPELQDALLQLTGRRTVPQVFIAAQGVGGYDDTNAARKSGLLQRLLAKVGLTSKA